MSTERISDEELAQWETGWYDKAPVARLVREVRELRAQLEEAQKLQERSDYMLNSALLQVKEHKKKLEGTPVWVPGTFVSCMSSHYFPVVRGDEECPTCALRAERDRLAEVLQVLVNRVVALKVTKGWPADGPEIEKPIDAARAALAELDQR